MPFVLRHHKELADREGAQWCQTGATGICVCVFCSRAVTLQEKSDIQRNHCVRPVLRIHFKKSLLLLCGGDKSNHIRRTCSAQAEEMLQVYMMARRKRNHYLHRQSSNICGPHFSVRELKFFSV